MQPILDHSRRCRRIIGNANRKVTSRFAFPADSAIKTRYSAGMRCQPTRLRLGALLLAAFLPLIAGAQQSPENQLPVNAGYVSTRATAHRRVPNTVADVSVGIQTEGQSADAVGRDLAQRSQALLGWLRGMGAERLATEQVSFTPQMHADKGGKQSIVGYSGSTSVSFRTTPEKLGPLLSGVLEHGANTIQQTAYGPTEEEQDKVRKELAQEATRAALAQAEAVAVAAGTRVLGVREVDVEPVSFDRPINGRQLEERRSFAAVQPIATEAGEQDLSVNVAVRLTVTR